MKDFFQLKFSWNYFLKQKNFHETKFYDLLTYRQFKLKLKKNQNNWPNMYYVGLWVFAGGIKGVFN